MTAWRRRWMALIWTAALCLPAQAAELTVSAAASLTQAFRDLAPLFEAANPGHKLQFNFAASGPLLQQITKGARDRWRKTYTEDENFEYLKARDTLKAWGFSDAEAEKLGG